MPDRAADETGPWIAAIGLMAVCAIATSWFPLRAIGSLPSQNYNEGWNAYRQWMVLQGQPLYGARSLFFTTNYAPLSFHLIGLLAGARTRLVLAGRVVSFAALIAVTGLTGAIVRRFTGSRAGGLFAALALFAGLCSFDGEDRAVDDPELLSAAFATFGIFAMLRGNRRWVAVAALAFCLSLFTKQDYAAYPLSVAALLVSKRDWRGLAVFTGVGFAACGVLLAVSMRVDGRYLLAEVMQKRAYGLPNLLYETAHYLLHFAAPLVIGVGVLLAERETPHRRFLLLLVVVSNLAAVLFAGGDGVASNMFYPAIIADILACAIGICRLRDARRFRIALLWVCLGGAITVPFRLQYDMRAASALPAASAAAARSVALLKAAPGPAICEDLLLCFEAGKPMDYDPYYVKDQILIGHLPDARIAALLKAHHYGAIQLGAARHGPWQARMAGRFTLAFQREFMTDYRAVMVSRYDLVFVPSHVAH